MDEILRNLPPGARVLDLGSGSGSFDAASCPAALVVRADNEPKTLVRGGWFVLADAARLPFPDGAFDCVVANHCLEHMPDVEAVLREIGRVVRSGGNLFVSVPDASTLTDRVYRWIYHGGGHISPIRSPEEFRSEIARATGLQPTATRTLCASLWFLNRRCFKPRPPRRLWLLGNGNLRLLALLSLAFRKLDGLLGARFSVYGWEFYFGELREEVETYPWTNVCVGCGAGHSAASLVANHRVRRWFGLLKSYHCPNCGVWNLFTADRAGPL